MAQSDNLIWVIGGGAWGAAIACALQQNKSLSVSCLVRDPATAAALRKARLPRLDDVTMPTALNASTDPRALASASAIYVAVPASATQEALLQITRHAPADCPVILCAKGLVSDEITNQQLFLPEYMTAHHQARRFAIFSGPSFADEVLAGLPCALVAASEHPDLCAVISDHFSASALRIYHGADPLGTAICGAVKNIIAVAAGVCVGLDLGDNAKAAILTRGLAETGRLITALGGAQKTLTGLAGIGDLSLSAATPHSRNMAYGLALARQQPLPNALAEGARTAPLLHQRALALDLDMPITAAVSAVLAGKDLGPIITDLLHRPFTKE